MYHKHSLYDILINWPPTWVALPPSSDRLFDAIFRIALGNLFRCRHSSRPVALTVGVYFLPWVPGSLGHSSRCSIKIGDHGTSNWDVDFNHFSGDMAPWHLKITGNRKTQCHPLVNQHIFPTWHKNCHESWVNHLFSDAPILVGGDWDFHFWASSSSISQSVINQDGVPHTQYGSTVEESIWSWQNL